MEKKAIFIRLSWFYLDLSRFYKLSSFTTPIYIFANSYHRQRKVVPIWLASLTDRVGPWNMIHVARTREGWDEVSGGVPQMFWFASRTSDAYLCAKTSIWSNVFLLLSFTINITNSVLEERIILLSTDSYVITLSKTELMNT